MYEELVQRLAERGHPEVRYPHGRVFQFLDDGGTRVSLLAQRAHVTKQAMAQLVAHLEEHGCVERVPDPGDGRAKLVRTTARGRAVFAVAREFVKEVDERLDERLGPAKVQRLRALLKELQRRAVMADSRLAVVEAWAQAYSCRGLEGMLALSSPDIVVARRLRHEHGQEAVRGLLHRQSFGVEMQPRVRRLFHRGDTVVVDAQLITTWVDTGEPAGEQDGAAILVVRGGRIGALRTLSRPRNSASDAGLSEPNA